MGSPPASLDTPVRLHHGNTVTVHLTENLVDVARLLLLASRLKDDVLVVERARLNNSWLLLVPDTVRSDQSHRYAARGKGQWSTVVLKNGLVTLEQYGMVRREETDRPWIRLTDRRALNSMVTAWDDHVHGTRPPTTRPV